MYIFNGNWEGSLGSGSPNCIYFELFEFHTEIWAAWQLWLCAAPPRCVWLFGAVTEPSPPLLCAGTWTWACGPRRSRRWCAAASPRRCGARCGSCWQGVTTTTTWWRSTGSSSQRYRAFFQLYPPPFPKEWEFQCAWGSLSVPECIKEWLWFSSPIKTLVALHCFPFIVLFHSEFWVCKK